MAFNPMALMKIRKMWGRFNAAHPRLLPYVRALGNGYLEQGSVVEVNVTAPDGRNLRCNLRITEEDMELMKEISELTGSSAE